jgi:glucosamine--fructose-6-phosphate aminotransferase (isomerizing)
MSHMLDEIQEQPDVVRRIMETEFHRAEALAAEIKKREIAYAYVAARGTSDNAAMYGKYMLEIQHGLPVALAAPSVFTLYESMPRFGENALVLGISQSGAAPDVNAVMRRAREAGALTACITNSPDSDMAGICEYPLLIGATEELGVAATKTYTGSLALLALLSTAMDDTHPERLEHLRRVPDAMERTLHLDDTLHHLVERYAEMRDCIVLGRGYNHATANEVALKITETCYVSAQAFSAADFQHGPIAQVAAGFPCLLFAPDGKAFAPMVKLAEILRERHPALICFAHDPAFLARSETAIRVPAAVAEWVSPLVYAVAGQLFSYWLSVARGNDPDSPRGLAKVTQTV